MITAEQFANLFGWGDGITKMSITGLIAGRDDQHAAEGWQRRVHAFHETFAHPIRALPTLLDDERMRLRISWIDEELGEIEEAQGKEDLPGVADGIIDALYFLVGTAVEMGIDLAPLFDAVHAANMAKAGGGKDAFGKTMKPPGWAPPDIAGELAKQGWAP